MSHSENRALYGLGQHHSLTAHRVSNSPMWENTSSSAQGIHLTVKEVYQWSCDFGIHCSYTNYGTQKMLTWDGSGMGPLKDALASLAWKWHPVRWGSFLLDVIYSLNQWSLWDAVSPAGKKHGFGNQVGVAKLIVTPSDHEFLMFAVKIGTACYRDE